LMLMPWLKTFSSRNKEKIASVAFGGAFGTMRGARLSMSFPMPLKI
jgi:hypothetical protein